jgi:hypothetical protein
MIGLPVIGVDHQRPGMKDPLFVPAWTDHRENRTMCPVSGSGKPVRRCYVPAEEACNE